MAPAARSLSPALVIPTLVAVLLLAAWHIAASVQLFVPHAFVGYEFSGDQLIGVMANSPAKRAGLEVNDIFVVSDNATRVFRETSSSGGLRAETPYRVIVQRVVNGHPVRRPVTIVPKFASVFQLGPSRAIATLLNSVAFMLAIGIAAVLLILRPGLMTLSLLLAVLGTGVQQVVGIPKNLVLPVVLVAWCLFQGGLASALLVFALRFPDDHVQGLLVGSQRLAIAYLVASESFLVYFAVLGGSKHVHPNNLLSNGEVKAFFITQGLAVIAAAIVLIVRYMQTDNVAARAKMRWAIIGVAVAAFMHALATVLSLFGQTDWWEALSAFVYLPLAAFAAYALLISGFVDSRVAVNRVLVMSSVALILAFAVGVLDWISSLALDHARTHTLEHWPLLATMTLDAGITITLGFMLSSIHSGVSGFADRVMFGDKREDEASLRAVAKTLVAARSEVEIEKAMTVDATRLLRLASAAWFRRAERPAESGAAVTAETEFVRGKSCGWGADGALQLTIGNNVVRAVAQRHRPVRIRRGEWDENIVPQDVGTPALAVPVLVRNELLAFVLYGIHADGTSIDAAEEAVIAELADGAQAGLEHVEAESSRRLLADEKARNAALQLAVRGDCPLADNCGRLRLG